MEKRFFQTLCTTTVVLLVAAAAQQRPRPPAGPRTISPIAKVPQTTVPAPSAGTVEGFVYWDSGVVAHRPASSCSGLAVTVSVGSSSGGPFEEYKPLGTLSNNFKYVGQTKSFLAGGKIVTYDVCTYGYSHVPVGSDLQVKLTVTQPSAFTSAVTPQFSTLGPIKIINGQCAMLPRLVNPTSSDLSAHWGSCQNMAYDVNFAILSSAHAMGGAVPGTSLPAPAKGQPMLSGGTRQGMLAQGGNSGMLSGRGQPPQTQRGVGINPGSKVELNPQPLPPKATASTHASKMTVSAKARVGTKLGSTVQSQKITNPKVALQNSSIIAVLRTQRQAAESEAAQMKLGLHTGGVQGQPAHTMSATTGSGMMNTARAVQPSTSVGVAANGGSSNRYAAMPAGAIPGIAVQCGHDPTMRIITVSGGPHPAIFTQDATYNFYTITGCSFGNQGPNAKVSIYYQGTFHQDFQIEEWSDNGIKLHLDPNLRGVDDQNNLTLVVQRADGKQVSKGGYKFYAARDTIKLSSIPKSDFSLNGFRPDQATTKTWQVTYTSASTTAVTPHLAGWTAEAHWDLGYDSNLNLVGGSDIYDFSHLHSTFGLDSAAMEGVNLSCTDPNYNKFASSGDWGIDWYGASGLEVKWSGQVCKNTPGSCGGAFQGDCFVGLPETNYGLNVWVTGPRGLDPWTGKPAR